MNKIKWSYLSELNDTKHTYQNNINLIQLFEEMVNTNPEGTAFIYQGLRFTYNEINKRSNQLAHFIKKFKFNTGSAIGIYFERSPETIVSFLAAMKSENIYIPIDTDFPSEMIKKILSDAKVPLIITSESFKNKARELALSVNAQIIIVDEQSSSFNQEEDKQPSKNIYNNS